MQEVQVFLRCLKNHLLHFLSTLQVHSFPKLIGIPIAVKVITIRASGERDNLKQL